MILLYVVIILLEWNKKEFFFFPSSEFKIFVYIGSVCKVTSTPYLYVPSQGIECKYIQVTEFWLSRRLNSDADPAFWFWHRVDLCYIVKITGQNAVSIFRDEVNSEDGGGMFVLILSTLPYCSNTKKLGKVYFICDMFQYYSVFKRSAF